ncbi:hypothetical protein V2U94_04030 [Paenibacillus polymyxa]|uniref:hypothetical protein n=1 Tax=Paenibacillus polymyxa TaxID=1406 RepID=UPI002ED0052E|nr:hypothetical protein [Paenibacillus polymyxa]
MDNKEIFATEIIQDGLFGTQYSFKECDILGIERWFPKSNYEIPLFYTTTGIFTVPTTHKEVVSGFPNFANADVGVLVNLKRISSIDTGDFGGRIFFDGSDICTTVNKTSTPIFDRYIEKAKLIEDDKRYIFATPHTKGAKSSLLPAKDILFTDMVIPKKNYYVPRFHFSAGAFVVGLTTTECKVAFPQLYPATQGNLINLDKVSGFDAKPFGITVLFKESDYTCSISNKKYKRLKKYV